jgi:hypothetical protein
MKNCPRCQKTFADDNLNFCLECGSVLQQQSSEPPPATVMIPSPPITQPGQAPPGSQPGWNVAPQNYSMQPPKKSSKAWVWVLLILGVLVVVCGGGLGGLIFLGAMSEKNTVNVSTNTATNTNSKSTGFSNKATNSSTISSSSRTSVTDLDLSKWEPSDTGESYVRWEDGELTMRSSKKGYYYALAGLESQKSVGADSVVTVRNADNADTTLGYGLIFHSDTRPLQQGYGFLIDSKRKRYRVVHHYPKNEDNVVTWTKSDAILDGTQSNILEARDGNGTVDLYINGKMVTSIKNAYGHPNGVIGLYAGDGINVKFKDLQLRK